MIYRVVCELREFLQLPRVSLYRLSHHLEDRVISVTMIFHLLQNSHVLMEQNWADMGIAEIKVNQTQVHEFMAYPVLEAR